jgi:hypothetical protein
MLKGAAIMMDLRKSLPKNLMGQLVGGQSGKFIRAGDFKGTKG